MPNTSDERRQVRADALRHVLHGVREIGCPPGQPQGWMTEFSRAIRAISVMLENQIAQAEQRIIPRKRPSRFISRKPRKGESTGGSVN
jgi:hypothetical protein